MIARDFMRVLLRLKPKIIRGYFQNSVLYVRKQRVRCSTSHKPSVLRPAKVAGRQPNRQLPRSPAAAIARLQRQALEPVATFPGLPPAKSSTPDGSAGVPTARVPRANCLPPPDDPPLRPASECRF